MAAGDQAEADRLHGQAGCAGRRDGDPQQAPQGADGCRDGKPVNFASALTKPLSRRAPHMDEMLVYTHLMEVSGGG